MYYYYFKYEIFLIYLIKKIYLIIKYIMQANEWGGPGWKFLHSVTFAYPQNPDDQTKQNYKNFFSDLKYTLPCSFCRSYYSQIIKYVCIDEYLDSREGLTWWLFIVHNLVNRKLKRNLSTFSDVVIKYENYRSRCGSVDNIKNYTQCKLSIKPICYDDIKENIFFTYSKYKNISKKQINQLYKSNEIIDPHFTKCSH